MSSYYFDHAASTPMLDSSIKVLEKTSRQFYANPSSRHRLGALINEQVDLCRKIFLKSLRIDLSKEEPNFLFTGSATEANNLIIRGLEYSNADEIVFFQSDHPSVIEPINHVCAAAKTKPIEINHAMISQQGLSSFLEVINTRTRLVVLSLVNHQSGLILPVEKMAQAIRKKNPETHIHVDAAQGFAKIPDFSASEVDSVTVTGHKMGGPKGVAGLLVKNPEKIRPLFFGGGHEYGLRPSTVAAPLIFSFTRAIENRFEKIESSFERIQNIKDSFLEKIENDFSEKELRHWTHFFPHSAEHKLLESPYTCLCVTPHIYSDVLLRHLEEVDIFASSSSACSTKADAFSPTLEGLGLPEKYHKNVLRISFSPETTMEDIDHLFTQLKRIIHGQLMPIFTS